MAPTQLVVFIEKQAGECMTPSPSKERIGARKSLHLVCALAVKRSKHFIGDMMNLVLLFS